MPRENTSAFDEASRREPDFSDAKSIAESLYRTAQDLAGMADDNAAARTVIAYASDRQNVLLAVATKRAREAGAKSMAEAEVVAMDSVEYQTKLEAHICEYEMAEKAAQKYRAKETLWESLRSMTSLQKSIASQV